MSKEALHEVLQLNLQISNEMEVFNASMKWAASRCQQLKMSIDGANLREVLSDNLFLIRFPTMTIGDISDTVIPQDILTDKEGFQILHYLTAKSKPENLPFPIEPRIDPTPRALLIPAPYDEQSGSLNGKQSILYHTHLNCTLSQPVQIQKIFIHGNRDSWITYDLTVTLKQNGKPLLNHDGEKAFIDESEGTPGYYAIEVKDACVEAGAMQVDIQLIVTNPHWRFSNGYKIYSSPTTLTKLSDKFVSLEFTPVDKNLFLGFQYSLN